MPYKMKSHAERMKESRAPIPDDRASSSDRGYDRRWRRKRLRHLKREPLCRQCKAAGYTVAAKIVDHIIPLLAGGADDESNFQSLCMMHHNQKTGKERGQ